MQFLKDFYPTPDNIIDLMLSPLSLKNKVILEPSAGNGSIITKLLFHSPKQVLSCEINATFASHLQTISKFIKPDFLDVTAIEISHIDYIIMNPPFSADEKHILHAWNIAPEGCEIVALCNSETLDNRYSYNRSKLYETVNKYGNSQNLGKCFTDAERQTDVNVSMIRLFKPKTNSDTEFDDYFFDTNEEIESSNQNGLMPYNEVRNIVNRYVAIVKLYDNVLDLGIQMNNLTDYFGKELSLVISEDKKQTTKDDFKKTLQKQAWDYVFRKLNMQKYVTQSVMSDINRFVEQQIKVPFTMTNIYKMIELIVGTHSQRMDRVIIEAFDEICSYSSDNSEAGEKWKTNSNYKVNRNFIIPSIGDYQSWHSDINKVYVSYRGADRMNDIIKALCYITGTDYNIVTPLNQFVSSLNMYWGAWHSWCFFDIKVYKKGTMHVKFQDEKVWRMFNERVAKIKGWQLTWKTDNKHTGKERKKSNKVEIF